MSFYLLFVICYLLFVICYLFVRIDHTKMAREQPLISASHLIICLSYLQFVDLAVGVYMKFEIGLEIAPCVTVKLPIDG
jgi:hypothetical protein